MTDDFLHQPRWLYIGGEDEQIHGPFPSTEMNNWLGGNFFQPNLMLKLIEDHEFYSLEHLVQACENENPFSFPGNSYHAVVTNAIAIVQQQRVQSVPISGGYSSLPATPSSTPTPGPGGFMAAGGADAHQFQQQPQPPPPPAGPPMVTFPIQYVRTSMGGQPLHPTQFLMMPPPLPPTIGPNVQQIGAPPLTTGMFRPGPQPPPMFSPPNQPQQPQPPIPVSTISAANGFLSPAQAAAFHHQLIQQQSQQQQRAPPQPIIGNGGPLLPSFPPPPPFSMPETRFPPPTLLQLQHHQNHHHLHHSQQNGTAEHHHRDGEGGQQQNGVSDGQQQQKEKEEVGNGTTGMMKASDSPDSGHVSQVVTPEREYDPELFLKMAEKYREGSLPENLPDLIQSSEKLWLAAAYTVKIYFLKLQQSVHLATHRSLRYFCLHAIALKKVENVLTGDELFKAWKLSEKHHKYAYGNHMFRKSDFEPNQEKITFFVREFPNIDKDKAMEFVNKLIAELDKKKSEDIEYSKFDELVKPKLGGEEFNPIHKFY